MTESQFFDIDHVLMEAERVQAEFLGDCYNCDQLEQGSLDLHPSFPASVSRASLPPTAPAEGGDNHSSVRQEGDPEENPLDAMPELTALPRGSRLKLPVWLAFGFLNQRFIAVQLQDVFEADSIKTSISHPEGLNLKEKCLYYYEVGALLSQRLARPAISGHLGRIYLARLKEVFKILFNESDSTTSNNFLQKLSCAEERFYDHGKLAFEQFRIWHSGKHLETKQFLSHLSRKKIRNDRAN